MRTRMPVFSDLQQKARERTVKTQNIEYDLETLVKKIKKGMIKLEPEYQRRHRWDIDTSSKLIESLILNIPIPLIYLSQDVDVDAEINDQEARYSVIDGQQRLTAIVNFMENKFALDGLDVLQELDGKRYNELPPFLIRRLEERTVKCLRIDSTVDEQVKYDIFERLNSGSVKLEPQELRNAIERGPFNDLIKDLAKDSNFRALLQVSSQEPDKSTKVKKMEDVELVLRFFALREDKYKTFKKGFKQFLSDEMRSLNKCDQEQLSVFKANFIQSMEVIRTIFGDEGFAKYRYEGRNLVRMSKFNAAVFDALALPVSSCLSENKKSRLLRNRESIKNKFLQLFKNKVFFEAVSGSVNDREKVVVRIDMAKKVIC